MTIAQWLSQDKRDYRQGVALFERFGGDSSTLALLKSSENSFTRSTLFDELTELHNLHSGKNTKPAERKPIKVEIPLTENYHPDIAPFYNSKQLYYKEMNALKQRLKLMANDEERFVACLRIDELDMSIDECWHTIDFFKEHGHLPVKVDEFPIRTIRDVVAQAKNIPTYISKIDARLRSEKMPEEDRPGLIAKKIRYQLQLEKIEKLLDEPIQVQ